MAVIQNPANYDAWYQSPRGAWIGQVEFSLLQSLLRPTPGTRLLDTGCGTGWFSRRFAECDLQVTGIDADPAAMAYSGDCEGVGYTVAACALPENRLCRFFTWRQYARKND